MVQVLRRRIKVVWRYFFPTAGERAYLARIRESESFDRAFYLRTNPRLRRLFHIWPERHYVQLGERQGTCPNPRFSPRAYMFHNPDLPAGIRPLLHHIETGQREGRPGFLENADAPRPGMPVIDPAAFPPDPQPFAIAIHVFYPDFWTEILPILMRQVFGFDLFVTVTDRAGTEGLEARIAQDWPQARIWRLPNLGRDILPFTHLLNAGAFEPYKAVCKLHSKKSPHLADGDAWRQMLVGALLAEPARTRTRLCNFLKDAEAGVWVADEGICSGDMWWGMNRVRAQALLARLDQVPPKGSLRFPAGSIYWIKPDILGRWRAIGLRAGDFEPEQALVDGTTAHAVERLIGWIVCLGGRRIVSASALDP